MHLPSVSRITALGQLLTAGYDGALRKQTACKSRFSSNHDLPNVNLNKVLANHVIKVLISNGEEQKICVLAIRWF